MRNFAFALLASVSLFAAAAQAQAAPCSGSVLASGLNLTMGTPVKLAVVAQAGCVNQAPSTLAVGGSAPGTIMTVTPDANWNDFKFTPTAVGSGTVTFSGPGFNLLSIPVVVSPGNFDMIPGN